MWKNIRAPGVLSGTQAARNRYQFSAAAPTGKQTSRNNETRRQFPQQKPINLSLLTRGEIVHFSQTAYFKLTVSVCFSTAEMKHHPWQLLLLSKFGYISLKLDQKACFIKKYAYLLCTFFWQNQAEGYLYFTSSSLLTFALHSAICFSGPAALTFLLS